MVQRAECVVLTVTCYIRAIQPDTSNISKPVLSYTLLVCNDQCVTNCFTLVGAANRTQEFIIMSSLTYFAVIDFVTDHHKLPSVASHDVLKEASELFFALGPLDISLFGGGYPIQQLVMQFNYGE